MEYYGENGLNIICDNGLIAEADDCPCGLFLAYEPYGKIFKANSIRKWTQVYHTTFTVISDIATNGEYWIAAGHSQTNGGVHFAKSIDGETWNEYFVEIEAAAVNIAWNGSYWIAFTYGAYNQETTVKILKSYNGEVWTATELEEYKTMIDPAWNGDFWLGSAIDFENHCCLLKSSDGTTWERYDAPSTYRPMEDKTYNGYLWVASIEYGGTFSSVDGINWTLRSDEFYRRFAWNGEFFLAIHSQSGLKKSYDGITWGEPDNPLPGGGTYFIWNGSFWIAVGSSHYPFRYTEALKSYDGESWEYFEIPYRDIRKIASIPAPNLYPPIGIE